MAPGGIGRRWRRASRNSHSAAAAIATRISTKVSGGTVSTAISMKMKALLAIAALVAEDGRKVTPAAVERARTVLEATFPTFYVAPNVPGDFEADFADTMRGWQRLADIVVVAGLVLAGCSLTVAVAAGLNERKRPFSLLRLSGASVRLLRRVVALESMVPLLTVAVVAVGMGLVAAHLFLRAQMDYDLRVPGAGFAAVVALGVLGCLAVVYRRQGDDNLLVEYGPMALDLALRLRVHLLMEAVHRQGKLAAESGLIDLTPGIRSLQIHYDSTRLSRSWLLGLLREIEQSLPRPEEVSVPSRIVHLPLSWNDPQARLAMQKYQELVRPNAPWCPDNIEFIRRINGLPDIDAVRSTIFDASYLVLGLGDVYLGAPVATPMDPRHRLVTTKYNPARTWTPENAVGIGGAYMCIYGMEGPGGYQLFGRTIQVWNTWRRTPAFAKSPWLLDFFDQIRFFPVSHDELMEAREGFPHGAYPVRIEETTLSYAAYAADLARNAGAIAAFSHARQAAFETERRRWKEEGLDSFVADDAAPASGPGDIPNGHFGVSTSVPGNIWKILVEDGAHVEAGQPVAIIESMKMEITVTAHAAGAVRDVRAGPGRNVRTGDVIIVLEEI